MSPQPDTCPGCGATVHPEALYCAACGTALHAPPRRLMPMLVGAIGVVAALAAGVGVWVLLAPKPGAPPVTAVAPAPPPTPPVVPAAPEPPPPAASLVPPVAPQIPTLSAPNTAPAAGNAETLPLPTTRPGTPPTPSDPASRRAFAKTTQDNFVQNGLDMVVATTGSEATVLTMKFNFPAKSAVELIVSGPFPRQCKTRGFEKVLFTDPTNASWTYDVATEKLTQK